MINILYVFALKDFATRSLSDSELDTDDATAGEIDDLAPFQMRRHWEKRCGKIF